MWEILREKCVTLRGGLKIRLKNHLQLKTKERGEGRDQLWVGYKKTYDKQQ